MNDFDGSHRPVHFATGGETICRRALNRPVRNPKLLLHIENSRVKALTELAKKPRYFPPMLTTVLPITLKCVTSLAAVEGRGCTQFEKEGI